MESVIKSDMLKYLHENDLISGEQHGFLSRRSTGTQLLECTNDWVRAINDNKCVDVVYLDYQKAFDSVSSAKLLLKLEMLGIGGFLLKWIRAFLAGRKQRVVVNDAFSDYCNVISGVPQGSVLGPLLFLLYINDIHDCVLDPGIKLKLFADDVKLYVIYDKCLMGDRSLLCDPLERILAWSCLWQLNLAIPKCFILYIGRPGVNPKLPCLLDGQVLESDSTVRDLGIHVSQNMKFSNHCQFIAAKAYSRMSMIFKCFSVYDKQVLLQAFKTYVRPLLEYNTYIWNPHYAKDIAIIENVQRRFTRRLFEVCDFGHPEYEVRLQKLGLDKLQLRRTINDLVMCRNIVFGLADLSYSDFFVPSLSRSNRPHSFKIQKCLANSDTAKHFFSFRVVELWNSLSSDVISKSTVDCFRVALKKYLGSNDV